jgi:oligopeptide/dipeptide ABC transporter ATP-binding protein
MGKRQQTTANAGIAVIESCLGPWTAQRHANTRGRRAIGRGQSHQQRLPAIEGTVPSLFNLPSGCRFHDRCQRAKSDCKETLPALVSITENEHAADGDQTVQHGVRCFYPLEGVKS